MKKYIASVILLVVISGCELEEPIQHRPEIREGDLVVHKLTGDTLLVRVEWTPNTISVRTPDYRVINVRRSELEPIECK